MLTYQSPAPLKIQAILGMFAACQAPEVVPSEWVCLYGSAAVAPDKTGAWAAGWRTAGPPNSTAQGLERFCASAPVHCLSGEI